MKESSIVALLSVISTRGADIEAIAEEKRLADSLHKAGYVYQKRQIIYNKYDTIVIFMVYGPVSQSLASKRSFKRVMSGLARYSKQKFIAFVQPQRGADVVTSDLVTVVEHLDEQDSNWIVCRYSAWVLSKPFEKMNVTSVRFISTKQRRGLLNRICSFFVRRKYVKRGRE